MNDIFNPYQEFTIVYIDDVLIFSQSIEQHFKHLRIFHKIIKQNGLVVTLSKIKLFQQKIRFLGYDIFQGKIKSIQRSIKFANKFSNEITNKNQLQRFLGCLNYITDFIPNLRRTCEPLYQRLRKIPPPWTHEPTCITKTIKSLVKSLLCLSIINPHAPLIVETDASDIGNGGILKQSINSQEQLVRDHSGIWLGAQKNYLIVKKRNVINCFMHKQISKRFDKQKLFNTC